MLSKIVRQITVYNKKIPPHFPVYFSSNFFFIGDNIRKRREIQCLPYAGFVLQTGSESESDIWHLVKVCKV